MAGEANSMVSVYSTLCRWTATATLSMPLNDRGISDYIIAANIDPTFYSLNVECLWMDSLCLDNPYMPRKALSSLDKCNKYWWVTLCIYLGIYLRQSVKKYFFFFNFAESLRENVIQKKNWINVMNFIILCMRLTVNLLWYKSRTNQ